MLQSYCVGQSIEFKYEGITLRGIIEKISPSGVAVTRQDFRSYKRSIRNRWHPPDRTIVAIEDIIRIEEGPH